MKRSLLHIILLTLTATAFGQGSLTPPSGPTPTMKTLDQIEPRTPVDATNTPGDANSAFRITAPGSYYLTGTVTGEAGKHGILVDASDVTIDLRGFTLAGGAGTLDGIHVGSGQTRLTVKNGTIASWEGDGVDEVDGGATDGIYERVQSTGNSGDGLRLGARATVSTCRVGTNSVYGLTVSGTATIHSSTAENNGGGGFYIGSGSVLDSVASGNGSAGFQSFGEPVLFKKCVATDNGGSGFQTADGGKIDECTSRQNIFGIEASSFSSITSCTVKNNSTGIFVGGSCHIVGNLCIGNGAGIRTDEDRNVIKGNQAVDGETGILTLGTSTDNLIIGNTAGNNSTNNYDISADNHYGPVVDITAPGTSPVVGNSGGGTTLTSSSWANFAY